MKRILIAYFSHTGENWFGGQIRKINKGNTAIIAEKIQNLTGGDLFEIRATTPYPVNYQECCDVAKKEKQAGVRPTIVGPLPDVSAYDIIYLGYPIWWGTFPMPVFTFLEQFDWSGKFIVPFSTHEGSGLGSGVEDILRVARGSQTLEAVAFEGSKVETVDRKVVKWVERTSR